MLEIKNVTKIYHTRGGVSTRALDDVSISFGETGLVFLLGKSGSGKSTLLNVSGGLDEPTSGEIIVKGKSSKDFSGSDFDSYRNTFVGFIFQEYNILDEFNVEENVALALELQGKTKDREKIAKILREVELDKYAKRKPNTLSGGQKQRVAIARALVKDPQIIMADEPTGALDSATGRQVFETLKKLSLTRLVIVVSHDREFAEIYGDRIVELKDGIIISDVSKVSVPPETLDENISVIGGNTLSIKSGAALTKDNIAAIEEFISASSGDVIITRGEEEVSAFKKATRTTDGGAVEKFDETNEEDIPKKEYTAEQSKFIRSRLPASKAIKIGASGLKLKPIRLVFTVLLSVIAFTMFGLASTMMLYNETEVTVNSFMQSEYDYINIAKYRSVPAGLDFDGTVYYDNTPRKFTDGELSALKADFGGGVFGCYNAQSGFSNADLSSVKGYYYYNVIESYACVPSGHALLNGLIGTYPANENEICISQYAFEVLKAARVSTVTADGEGNIVEDAPSAVYKINTEEDIIGKFVKLNYGEPSAFKVTGIFKSGEIPSRYENLKNAFNDDYLLINEYVNYIREGLACTLLVSEGFNEKYGGLADDGIYYEKLPEEEKYDGIMLPYDKSASAIKQVLGIVGQENIRENGIKYELENSLYNTVGFVSDMVEVLSNVFLWIGVVFAVFSALLLFNFISVSIINKRKEIGILRAVGARGLDVFKIFFSESGIIVGVCTVLSLIFTALICSAINGVLKAEAGIGVTLFVFGLPSVCVLVGIAVLVAVIATFLPVFFASRKKPVDSIRSL